MQPTQTQPLPPLTAAPTPVVPTVSTMSVAQRHGVFEIIFAILGKGLLYGTLGGAALGGIVGLPFLLIGAVPGAFIGGAMGFVQGLVNGLLLGIVSRVFFYPLMRPTLYQAVLLILTLPIGFFGTLYMSSTIVTFLGRDFSYLVAALSCIYAIFASQRTATHYISLVGTSAAAPRLRKPINPYNHAFLKQLFDAMQSSYATVSWICSFGFSKRWRRQLIARLDLRPGMQVGDFMSGTGEIWPHLAARISSTGGITAVDFSPHMAANAQKRKAKFASSIVVLEEDSLRSSITTGSLDALVCCYGVKTLAPHEQAEFAREASRVLASHGIIGIVEISRPASRLLRWLYIAYLRWIVPLVGRIFLADPLSYRMLADYLEAFDNCRDLEQVFGAHGFELHYFELFGGCASGFVGMKVGTP